MAKVFLQSPYQDEQLYIQAYEGKRAKLCLALNPGNLTISSNASAWNAVELSGNGYARSEWTIPAGSYNTTTGRFEAPSQLCEFTASANGAGLTWNAAYIILGVINSGVTTWNSGISFYCSEPESIALLPGQTKSYQIRLFTNGFEVTS